MGASWSKKMMAATGFAEDDDDDFTKRFALHVLCFAFRRAPIFFLPLLPLLLLLM